MLVPFDKRDNMQRWKVRDNMLRRVEPFYASLHLDRFEQGSSAYAVFLDDQGHSYPVGLAELAEVMTSPRGIISGEIHGQWAYARRGRYYSLRMVEE